MEKRRETERLQEEEGRDEERGRERRRKREGDGWMEREVEGGRKRE